MSSLVSGGGRVIYGITTSGDLMWYRHDGRGDGSFSWTGPKKVGNGWDFKDILADEPGSEATIFRKPTTKKRRRLN